MKQSLRCLIASLPMLTASSLSGCSDIDDPEMLALDSDDAGPAQAQNDGPEELAATFDPAALGELACATTSLADPHDGATVSWTAAPNCGYSYDAATSPDSSYDPTGCPNRWITQVNSVYGRPLDFYVVWAGADLDETTCELASIHASSFGHNLSAGIGGAYWERLDSMTLQGHWGGYLLGCRFEPVNRFGELNSLPSGHPYWSVRVAAFAQGFLIKQPVTAGIVHGPGPC